METDTLAGASLQNGGTHKQHLGLSFETGHEVLPQAFSDSSPQEVRESEHEDSSVLPAPLQQDSERTVSVRSEQLDGITLQAILVGMVWIEQSGLVMTQ